MNETPPPYSPCDPAPTAARTPAHATPNSDPRPHATLPLVHGHCRSCCCRCLYYCMLLLLLSLPMPSTSLLCAVIGAEERRKREWRVFCHLQFFVNTSKILSCKIIIEVSTKISNTTRLACYSTSIFRPIIPHLASTEDAQPEINVQSMKHVLPSPTVGLRKWKGKVMK